MGTETYELTNQPTGQFDLVAMMEGEYSLVAFKKAKEQKQSAADKIVTAIEKIAVGAFHAKAVEDGTEKDVKLVADLDEETKKKYLEGAIKLVSNKDTGEIFAQIREASGQFGKRIPLKEEVIAAGINPMDAGMAMQLKAIEDQLEDMMEALEEIGNQVRNVLKGQHNDRIGIFYSGMNLLMEAQSIQNDDIFKNMLTAQGIRAISDANGQLTQEIQECVSYLDNKEFEKGKLKRDEKEKKIDEIVQNIHKCFDIINKSYALKSYIYFQKGELQAMATAIEEYRRFINQVIIPYAPMLGEYDKGDMKLIGGIWEQRAEAIDAVENMKQYLLTSDIELEV